MKSLCFKFGHDIFKASKWQVHKVEMTSPSLKSWHFKTSEDIITKINLLALHVMRIKLKWWWVWQPSLSHSCSLEKRHFTHKQLETGHLGQTF